MRKWGKESLIFLNAAVFSLPRAVIGGRPVILLDTKWVEPRGPEQDRMVKLNFLFHDFLNGQRNP